MKQFRYTFFALLTLFSLLLAACGQSGETAGTDTAPAAEVEQPAEQAAAEPSTAEESAGEPTAESETTSLGAGGGEKIVIWHNWQGDYYTAIEKIFADYAEQNNVSIDLVRQADLSNKVQIAVPSGQGPDVIAWVDDQIGKNALSGIIQPVSEYGIDQNYLTENFTNVAAQAMIYNDQVYGVPESLEALTMIYNKDLIAEGDLPADTDALIAQAKEYNGDNKYLFVYNAKNDAYFSVPWWLGSGAQLVTPEGTTEMNSEAGVKAGQLIQSFTEIMPKEIDYNVADTLFKEGKAAMIMNGPWSIADYEGAGIDVGLTTIPVVSNSGQPGKPFVGVKMLMLAANAKNAQAAADVMKYYGTAEVQAELARVNKQVPANIQAQEEVKSDPIIAGFIAQAEQGEPLPNTEFIDAMWDPIAKTVEAIWTGASPPEEAVQDGAALFEEKAQDLR